MEWKSDFKSSLVVFLVALPLCLGIALASGAPLASGLLAGIIGGIVIGFLSGSQISVSGPAAGLTVIVANGISQLGSFEVFCLAIFLAGVIQIIFSIVRGGAIGNYFPTAVIKGMLAAIGLILILKQFPNALGLSKDFMSHGLGNIFSSIHVGIFLISVISLTIMLGWEKLALKGYVFFKTVPGALVAVATSVALNFIFIKTGSSLAVGPSYLVQLPFSGGFSEIFAGVKVPQFSLLFDPKVFQIALTISLVASLETLLCVDAADKIDPMKRVTSKDRELMAQGVGNALSGLLGGLPLTAVIVRTSANVAAGNKTKLSAILHGVWILLCVAFIPGVLNMIPLASLACVLLLVGYKLTKPSFFVDMKKKGWDQLFVFTVTIFAILGTDLLKGIFIGIIAAIIFELRNPAIDSIEATHEDDKVIIKFTQNVSFFHKAKVAKILAEVPNHKTVHIAGINNVRVHMDIHDVIREAETNGVKIHKS